MASILSAGTTSGTALNMSGDTSGVLQLATNGTTTALTLDASQNATFAGTLTTTGITNSGVATGARFNPTGSSVTGNGMYLPAANSLGLSTNGTNAVYIDSSQNVGIGTSSPTHPLTVSGASGIIRVNSTGGTTTSNIGFTNTGGSFYLGLDSSTGGNFGAGNYGAFLYNGANSPMVFFTNGSKRMLVTANGELCVGANSVGDTGWTIYPSGYSITNGSTSTFTHMSFQTSSSQKGYIQTVGATTNYNGSSDYRLKKNVIPLPNALQTIAQLKPVKFNWIEDDSVAYSFIAHELQEVVPQAVGGTKDEVDENGKPVYQGIDPSKLVCFLTAAIQELSAKNDALTARIVALEAK